MNHGDIKLVIDQLHGMELTPSTDEVIIFNAINALETLANERDRLRAALADLNGSFGHLARQVLQLIERLEAAEKDATRYRWLRNPDQDVGNVIDKRIGTSHDITGVWEYRAGDELDNAIDAAMKEKP